MKGITNVFRYFETISTGSLVARQFICRAFLAHSVKFDTVDLDIITRCPVFGVYFLLDIFIETRPGPLLR